MQGRTGWHGAAVGIRPGSAGRARPYVYDRYLGSTKITTHLDHTGRCKIASGTNWSNRWTYRVSALRGMLKALSDSVEGILLNHIVIE